MAARASLRRSCSPEAARNEAISSGDRRQLAVGGVDWRGARDVDEQLVAARVEQRASRSGKRERIAERDTTATNLKEREASG
jgi:hypothetical protein